MTDSFDILAAEYRPMVVAYLRSMVGDPHLAEDLAQESFLAAQDSIAKFEKGGNFGRWLRGIARNKALMHWRSAKRSPLLVDSRVVEGIDGVFDSLDRNHEDGDWWERRKRSLRECIQRLSAPLKGAIEQVYFKEQSLAEAATTLDSSRSAIGKRVSRARHELRLCVQHKLQSTHTPS
jgi:RNA polymerase sigma-70 factor (ECF subfamily)